MTKVLKLEVPLEVWLPRKTTKDRKVILNLNNYRNWHYLLSNAVKKSYHKKVKNLLDETGQSGVVFINPVDVTFQLFKKTRRISDKGNIDAIHRKFFYDALTELGVWEDDNDDIVKVETMLETVHDKDNPRVEFVITERS